MNHGRKRCPVCRKTSSHNQPAPSGGPGTELEAIIPKFFATAGCNCKSYARKMDRWGVEGCRKRYDRIVDRLVREAGKVRVIKLLGVVNRAIAQHWLTQAIDNAERRSN